MRIQPTSYASYLLQLNTKLHDKINSSIFKNKQKIKKEVESDIRQAVLICAQIQQKTISAFLN